MPLDDNDKAEIAAMISEGNRPPAGPPARRTPTRRPTDDEWDAMPSDQQRTSVRKIVEEELAALDAEAERVELRQRVKELEAERAAVKKGGGKAPVKPLEGDEKPPTPWTRFQTFVWGSDAK